MAVKFYTNILTVSLSVFQGLSWTGSALIYPGQGVHRNNENSSACRSLFYQLRGAHFHLSWAWLGKSPLYRCNEKLWVFWIFNPIEPSCFVLTEEIPIKDELAFLPHGPELGISFYLNQIDNMTIRVFWCFLPVMKKTPVDTPFSTGWQRDSCLPWAKTRRAP